MKKLLCATEKLFFDTDCLSAFLWVNNENILVKLYGGKIVIPSAVYSELSHPGIKHLKRRIDVLKQSKEIIIQSIDSETDEYDLYMKLTKTPEQGKKVIGKGEAAAIALAKVNNGIVASNNLKDVKEYVTSYGLDHLTTGDILVEALEKGIITESQGNTIWSDMLEKRRKLPTNTFTEFLKKVA